MLKAVKENKIYSISEVEKQDFLDRGFDIISEDGKIEKSSLTPVTVEDLEKLKAEYERDLEKLKTEYEKKLARKDAEIKKLKGDTE